MGFIIGRLSHTFQEPMERHQVKILHMDLGSLIILCLSISLFPLVYVQ